MASPQAGLAVILSVFATQVRHAKAQAPVEAQWSSNPYGPDGPWNVVEMEIGKIGETQLLSFFPGAEFQTFTPTTELCAKNQTLQCFASYNEARSEKGAGSSANVQFQPPSQYYALGLKAVGEPMTTWVDDFWLGDDISIINGSMGLMDEVFIEYPNGDRYPPIAGCLAVGGDAVNQTFEIPSEPPLNASIIPGYLWERNQTESNSFTMHIGSVSPPVPGSLVFGGYDEDRVFGDVLALSGKTYRSEILLADLGIEVFQGDSPFNFTKKVGLLAEDDSSLADGLTVRLDGCSPYLTLPESTCGTLSDYLPISYNSGLGLYTWDIADDRYERILNSASALTFSLRGKKPSRTIVVSVPIQHLNLTLDEPLAQTPTPYFPCSTTRVNDYVLGRAFLQDAFVGEDWNREVFWIAQAPGPDGPRKKDVVEIEGSETPLKTRRGDWASTWTWYWSNLELGGAGNGGLGGQGTGGLSTAAKAGIGVGVSLGAISFIAAAVFFFWRSKEKPNKVAEPASTEGSNDGSVTQPGDIPELHPNPAPSTNEEVASRGPAQETWNDPVEVPASPIPVEIPGRAL